MNWQSGPVLAHIVYDPDPKEPPMNNHRIQLRLNNECRWQWRIINNADTIVTSSDWTAMGAHPDRRTAIAAAEHALAEITAQDVDVAEWHDYEPPKPKRIEFNIPKIAAEYRLDEQSDRLTAEQITRAMGYYDRGGHDR